MDPTTGSRSHGYEDDWPNCSVPDCEYKSWGNGMCYEHAHGRTPIPFAVYMQTPPIEEE